MASILDVGILEFFSPLFLFILVFAIVYAILDKFNIFKNAWVRSAIAFCMGILFLFSKDAITFINFVTPWFIVFVIVILFFLAIFYFIGIKSKTIRGVARKPQVYWTILVILFILLALAMVHVFGGPDTDVYGEDGEKLTEEEIRQGVQPRTRESEGLKALITPKLLGAILLLVIATFAIVTISKGLG